MRHGSGPNIVDQRLARPGRRHARIGACMGLVAAVIALHALLLAGAGRRDASGARDAAPLRSVVVVAPQVAANSRPQAAPAVESTMARYAEPAGAAAVDAVPVTQRQPAHRATERTAAGAPALPREAPPLPRDAAQPATPALPPPPRDDAPMPDTPPPVYATRPPPAALLRYALRRGDALGEATLRWQPAAERYELQLQATLPRGATLEQRSEGSFDDAGLAPQRLADRRRGRAAHAANFQRPQGRISFSGPRWEFPMVPGVQDRLSWLVQLAAIAAALPVGSDEVVLQVVGARGATARWRFRVMGPVALELPGGPAQALHLVREPEHLYDLRIELWLDPSRDHWPLRLRQAQVPGGETLEWTLEELKAPPPDT
ncbi:MAG: DUF3108 domain-containing protein [Burkholderiaceae bacterium]